MRKYCMMFLFEGSASRILPVFFLCLFGAELFWQKKSQAGFTCDFRNY